MEGEQRYIMIGCNARTILVVYLYVLGFGENFGLEHETHFHRHAICIYFRLHNGAFSGRDMPYRGQYRKTSCAAMKADVFGGLYTLYSIHIT